MYVIYDNIYEPLITRFTQTQLDDHSCKIVQNSLICFPMGLLPDTQNRGLRMRRECRERFPRHRIQRKLLVSDPGMHHGTCVTHVPWCMSGSLNCGSDGKRSQDSRRMRNSQFYVSGKRPIDMKIFIWYSFNSSPPSAAYMRQWIGSALAQIMVCRYSAPSHYLNQYWVIVNCTPRNKLHWNFHLNNKNFIHKNASQTIVCEMAAIFSKEGGGGGVS